MAFQNVIGGGAGAYLTETGITAAGTTQATATTLNAQENEVTTVAAGSGVSLHPLLVPGEIQTVFNAGANELKVYPASGVKINALTANLPMILPTNTGVLFRSVSTTRVFGILSV